MRVGWCLVVLLVPSAGAQDLVIEDPAEDVVYETQLGQRAPAPQEYPQADILLVWLGQETEETFAVGMERLADTSATDPDAVVLTLPQNLYVFFTFEGATYRIDFARCGDEAAGLDVQNDAVEFFDGFRRLDCIPADLDDAEWTAQVPKEMIKDAEGLPVRAGATITALWAKTLHTAATSPVGGTTVYAVDEAPNEGILGPFVFQMGESGFGPFTLSTPEPMRASNGGPETIVFPVILENRGDADDLLATAEGAPDGWDVRVPSRIQLEEAARLRFPVMVTTSSAHAHGTQATFEVHLQSASDSALGGSIELGIDFLAVPQLAGHHPDLYIHAGEPSQSLVGSGAPFQGWFNTLRDDESDSGEPIRHGGSGSGGGSVNYRWTLPLDPSLLIGMDFDLEQEGTFDTRITHRQPLSGAVLNATLWHCDPQRTSGERAGQDGCVSGSWFLLAHGASEPVDLAPESATDFSLSLAAVPYADLVPYVDDSNIALQLVLAGTGVYTLGQQTGVALEPGASRLHLPLNEYRDPLDEAFQDIGTIALGHVTDSIRDLNAGQTTWFVFDLQNRGDKTRTLQLSATGHNAEWARWSHDTVRLPGGDSREVALAVTAPQGASSGTFVEAFAVAEDQDDPAVVSISKVRAVVVEEPVEQSAAPGFDGPAKKSPALPWIASLLVLGCAIVLRRR